MLVPSVGVAQPPICNADGPYEGKVGESIQFDGTGSVAFPPHMILLYEWDFGDGATDTGPTPTHIYSKQFPGAGLKHSTIRADEPDLVSLLRRESARPRSARAPGRS